MKVKTPWKREVIGIFVASLLLTPIGYFMYSLVPDYKVLPGIWACIFAGWLSAYIYPTKINNNISKPDTHRV